MGNRAVIQFGPDPDALGIYLHWNGGPESVNAFLDYAKEVGLRVDDYGVARLAQVIGNYFGGILSVGVGLARDLDRDNWDNGTYVLAAGTWDVAARLYAPEPEGPYDPAYYDAVLSDVREANDRHFKDVPVAA